MIHIKKKERRISYAFLRVVWAFLDMEKRARHYGTDQDIFEAEIHLIKVIKENEGTHVSGLAEKIGVTKGAVSQLLQKLERKGLLTKGRDPENRTRLLPMLSTKGETAYRKHEEIHGKLEKLFETLLKEATKEEKTFLESFLTSLEEKAENFEH